MIYYLEILFMMKKNKKPILLIMNMDVMLLEALILVIILMNSLVLNVNIGDIQQRNFK
jgi:hypothetical protein